MTAFIVPACSDDEEDIFPPETGDSINGGGNFDPIPVFNKVKFIGTIDVNEAYTQDSVVCQVSTDSGMLTLDILNVKFAANMPMSISLTVPGIPCEGHNNNTTFAGDSIVPMMGVVPAASFMFESIEGSVVKHSLNFTAIISGRGTVSFNGQEIRE